jgi:hypothetical protein
MDRRASRTRPARHNCRSAAAGRFRRLVQPGSVGRICRRRSPGNGDAQRTNPGHIRLLQGIESDNQRSERHKHLNTSRYPGRQRDVGGTRTRLISHLIRSRPRARQDERWSFPVIMAPLSVAGGVGSLWSSITGSGLDGPGGLGDHRWVIFSIVYLAVRCLPGCLMMPTRR